MPVRHLSTTKIAEAVGCHPNTVRLYEQWGFLPPIPRSAKGYRLYTRDHLAQMQLARTAFNTPWPGRAIRRSVLELVKHAAGGDLGGALELAYRHLGVVQAELAQANAAVRLVERWRDGATISAEGPELRIADAARLLGLSTDVLRNWERDGLLEVGRHPNNRYRLYSPAEIARLRVIRMLRNAGYSTMSILRMLSQLDADADTDLRKALDTPREDEDILYATDRWLSTLRDQEQRALQIIHLLEERMQTQTAR